MRGFCEEGVIPKDYTHAVCQDEEMRDMFSYKESGEHEKISVCGADGDSRQYDTWYVKPDFSDVRNIYTFVFKKNVGLIAY